MIKNQTILEIKKDERVYQMHFSADSPGGEVFDILSQMRAFVLEKLQELSQTEQAPRD